MQMKVGTVLEGNVTGITKFGAFVDIGEGKTGMVHISEIASEFVNEIRDHLVENQTIKVKIINITDDGKIALSIKKALDNPPPHFSNNSKIIKKKPSAGWQGSKKQRDPQNFEDMLSHFKQVSDERMSDLKKMNETKRSSSRRTNSSSKQH